MIIGDSKKDVVANIQKATQESRFNDKVEVDDPVFDNKTREQVIAKYMSNYGTWKYYLNNIVARSVAESATWMLNRHTKIEGLENLAPVTGGAIITSNHFNPLENTAIRTMVHARKRHQRLYIVSEDTNLAMSGAIGYLMRNYDTIPISANTDYMGHTFTDMLEQALDAGQLVLIYPEQEMWFNYRKPRPVKRGAYYYAARFNVPIISCFVEMKKISKVDNDEFDHVRYVVHVLPPIFHDSEQSVRKNSFQMMQQDYQQKKDAYERCYHQPLTYTFQPDDIVGWRG